MIVSERCARFCILIRLVVRQHRAPPGVMWDAMPRSSALQYGCQITAAEQSQRRLEEPWADSSLENRAWGLHTTDRCGVLGPRCKNDCRVCPH